MWKAIQQRLNARWRRILFVPWVLLMLGGVVFTGLAAFHLYEGWSPGAEVPDNCLLILAYEHDLRVAPNKVRSLESPPSGLDILRCIADEGRQAALLNAKLLGMEAGRFFMLAVLLGFFIFTHGWSKSLRSFWGWVNMQNPQG